jgi:hypothetical protein
MSSIPQFVFYLFQCFVAFFEITALSFLRFLVKKYRFVLKGPISIRDRPSDADDPQHLKGYLEVPFNLEVSVDDPAAKQDSMISMRL